MEVTDKIKASDINITVNLQFLSDVCNIIEVGSNRGAWRADEMESLGKLYNNLKQTIKNVSQKLQKENDNVLNSIAEEVLKEEQSAS